LKRRTFVERTGKAAIGLGTLSVLATEACRSDQPRTKNWTWVHGGRKHSDDEWRAYFSKLRTAGLDAVLTGGGDTERLSQAAHAEGLEFHRWAWILNRSGDEWARQNHPEWFTVSRNGDSTLDHPPYVVYYRWLCPTREPVREYLSRAVGEIAADTNVDGVHLDYIRHSDVILPVGLWDKYDLVQDREYAEFDFCYCDVCREAFAQQTGTDPLELTDPPSDEEWRRFRWESVTGLVRRLTESAHAHGKPITAAVFPTPNLARRLVRQAWDWWPIDALFPMLYHEFYEEDIAWIGASVREGVTSLEAEVPLYAGLYLPSLTPDQLFTAVEVAIDAGAAGVSLFEMHGLTDDHLARLEEALTA
jgi:uncharacterized lipoprotein YddW (UPF0748 family)